MSLFLFVSSVRLLSVVAHLSPLLHLSPLTSVLRRAPRAVSGRAGLRRPVRCLARGIAVAARAGVASARARRPAWAVARGRRLAPRAEIRGARLLAPVRRRRNLLLTRPLLLQFFATFLKGPEIFRAVFSL